MLTTLHRKSTGASRFDLGLLVLAALSLALHSTVARAANATPTPAPAAAPAADATPPPKHSAAAEAVAAAAKAAGLDGVAKNAYDKITLMIVSDSTAAEYDSSMVVRGWGQYLQPLLPKGRVTVDNRAQPGRSAKSFMEQGAWKEALKAKPDYVIIQFGHNDAVVAASVGEKASVREFRKYLGGYIDTARKAGIVPILMTPTATRSFDKDDVTPIDGLEPYVKAIRDLADQRNVNLIDLHAQCQQFYKLLGKSQSQQLNSVGPDKVHFNELGARAVAAIVAKDLPEIELRFNEKVPSKYEQKLKEIVVPK